MVPGLSADRKKEKKKLKDAQAPNIKWHSTYINLESFNVAVTVYESQESFVVVVNAESGEFFFTETIMSSVNKVYFFLPSLYIFYFSLSCLVTLVKTSRTALNRSSERGHAYLVPSLRGKHLGAYH